MPTQWQAAAWSKPHVMLDLGGSLAVWAEKTDSHALPWLVLHGGPGASLCSAHVAPLRKARLPWFGFDQRNSGLSEDLDLSCIDLQRFIDDALEVVSYLGLKQFHILGGSWGATLALAIAAFKPEQVASLVLRAPFIPLRPRVDAFFEQLEYSDPSFFEVHFGRNARTAQICELFESATPDMLYDLSFAWSRLELKLLGLNGSSNKNTDPFLNDLHQLALIRKYRLQAHFFRYDCFLNANDWAGQIGLLASQNIPISIVQGQGDRICPPGGARFLSELISRIQLFELADTAHLADSGAMVETLSQVVQTHAGVSDPFN